MPKNPSLEYEAKEPAFLRRMKAGQAELDGRHNVQIPRARGGIGRNGRLDMHGEEGEDDPVVLDESGNVVSKEEMKRMGKPTDAENVSTAQMEQVSGDKVVGAEPERQSKDTKVNSGFGKKRKAAKVVGNVESERKDEDREDELNLPTKSLRESTKDLRDAVAQNKAEAKNEIADGITSKKGKRKKIKLSFDDPD